MSILILHVLTFCLPAVIIVTMHINTLYCTLTLYIGQLCWIYAIVCEPAAIEILLLYAMRVLFYLGMLSTGIVESDRY